MIGTIALGGESPLSITNDMNQPSFQLGTTADGAAFALLPDAATQKFAFLAQPGSGKTYAATKLAELFYSAGVPFVVLDSVGVWYGLRLASDGVAPGLPIPVFGGMYGDLPLEPEAGALVADLLVDRGLSLVLDVSAFRTQQRKRFVTDFAEQLFFRKKATWSPLHLFLEEAQSFIPQRMTRGEDQMLGAFEDLGKLGRNFGIGMSLISQRPQAVNKEVLNLTEVLIVLQISGARERSAIRAWIVEQSIDARNALDELPSLPIGTAYVWSPRWLRFFGKVQIGSKWTYDASATPTLSTAPLIPRPLDATDLAELRRAMASLGERADEHDSAGLRRRIADLEQRLAHTPPRQVERVEVPILRDGELAQLTALTESLSASAAHLGEMATSLVAALARVEVVTAVGQPPSKPAIETQQERGVERMATEDIPQHNGAGTDTDTAETALRAGERRVLHVLAQFDPAPLSDAQLGKLSGFAPRGGTFRTYTGTIRKAGLVVKTPTGFALTPSGRSYLGDEGPPRPATTEACLAVWRDVLRAGEFEMLRALLAPSGRLTKAELGPADRVCPKRWDVSHLLGNLAKLWSGDGAGRLGRAEPDPAAGTGRSRSSFGWWRLRDQRLEHTDGRCRIGNHRTMTDLIRNVTVPERQRGLWRIERFTVDEKGARAHNLIAARDAVMTRREPRSIVPGRYTRLWCDDEIVMSDTPAEMREHLPIVRVARGRMLINGLGLGMVVAACLDKPDVEHVTVVEVAPHVIELVADHYLARYGSRLTVVQADAFTWEPPADAHYAAVWHDIWPVVSPDNLLPMRQLPEKYHGRANWQGCWCYPTSGAAPRRPRPGRARHRPGSRTGHACRCAVFSRCAWRGTAAGLNAIAQMRGRHHCW